MLMAIFWKMVEDNLNLLLKLRTFLKTYLPWTAKCMKKNTKFDIGMSEKEELEHLWVNLRRFQYTRLRVGWYKYEVGIQWL